ncbi:hypothetical protein E4T25_18605, partial [Photobacterium damselae subsp. piscicida]|uniref:YadA C-terminal domain-containing protein n=2 Tax=Photobacterium damselae TaxID=38293 RepID=UPI0010762573
SERIEAGEALTDTRFTETRKNISSNTTKIATNTKSINSLSERIEAGEALTDTRFTETRKNISSNTTKIATNTKSINSLSERIEAGEALTDTRFTETRKNISSNMTKIATNTKNVANNAKAIISNSNTLERYGKQLNEHDEKITFLNNKVDRNTGLIKENTYRINKLEHGMSLMAAMSNLTQDDVTMALGYYNGNTALAMGINYALMPNMNVKFSAAADTEFTQTSLGVGIGYSFQ